MVVSVEMVPEALFIRIPVKFLHNTQVLNTANAVF